MTPKKPTTGDLIRKARLAKSRRIHDELIAAGQRIGRGETRDTMYRQCDLAKDIGVEQSRMPAYEHSSTMPSVPMLKKLAKALDVSPGDLIGE